MHHIWWQCSLVTRLWIRIFNLINSVTGVNICKSPEDALFHKLPVKVPRKTVKFITNILLAMRITIARHWKQSVTPLDYVKGNLNLILVNDKLNHTLHKNYKKFEKIWDPWIPHILVC